MNCERYARQQQAVIAGFNCKLDEWVLKKRIYTSSDLSLQHDDFSLMLVVILPFAVGDGKSIIGDWEKKFLGFK